MSKEQMRASETGEVRTRDGVRLHYSITAPVVAADGAPRVVLIHSLAMDESIWGGVRLLLAQSAQVLTLDCRGHGKSQKAPGPYTVEMFGDDVADVMNYVGWPNAVIAGCSMGGTVALAFANRHPQRVRALVLIDTTAWYGADAPAVWAARVEKARAEGLASMRGFQATRWFGDSFCEKSAKIVDETMNIFVKNDIDCYAATCAMLGSADLRGDLKKLCCPTSVIVGEEDYATPVETARNLQQGIDGASLKIISGARHLTPIEVPEIIASEISARLFPHA